MPGYGSRHLLRSGRSPIAVLIYLSGFVLLLLLLTHFYLIPAMAVASKADPGNRRILAAYARLILAVVLVLLLVGLMLTFRIGRFFRPRPTVRQKPTQYIDAWSESARRLKLPDEEQE